MPEELQQETQQADSADSAQGVTEQDATDQNQAEQAPDNSADTSTDDYDRQADNYDRAIDAANGATPQNDADSQQQSQSPEQSQQQSPAQTQQQYNDPRVDVLEQQFRQNLVQQNNKDFDAAVQSVKDTSPAFKALTDGMVRGIMEREVRTDPKFLKAFENRHLDVKGWNDLVIARGKRMAKNIAALPDENATNGVNRMRASVNSQTGSPDTSAQYADVPGMGDSEFLRKVEAGDYA